MKSPIRIAVIAFLAFVFATNCYRAATQSITHDEALTWELYLAGPASNIFEFYDANHHFLATILERISTTLLGNSEVALRLPSLLAGGWFLVTVYRLCLLVFGGGPLFALATLLACANPLVLDFLVAARGYGISLALFFYALLAMLELHTRPSGTKRLYAAGTALGLSIAANLTFLAPALVLSVLFAGTVAAARPAFPETAKRTKKQQPAPSAVHRVAPFLVALAGTVLLFFMAAPISKARMADFYAGLDSPTDSVRNLAQVSFAHNEGLGGLNAKISPLSVPAAAVVYPVLCLIAAALGFAALRRGADVKIADRLMFLVGGCVAGSVALLCLMHLAAGVPYPTDRTGLYFLPLAGLLAVSACSALLQQSRLRRASGCVIAAVAALSASVYLLQWNVSHFYVWRYGADSRQILERIDTARNGRNPVRVGISWQIEPAFNYYRSTRNWSWVDPFDRRGPNGDYDYYVLIGNDGGVLASRSLHEIYRGPVSGTVLASK